MPLTPGEAYNAAYLAARDRYREELRIADERFDRTLRESTETNNRVVSAQPWLRAQETERHRQVELVASLMHQKIHERIYEEFRESVRAAAERAWGKGK